MDIKAIKVCKLMHICAIIYTLWCSVYNNKKNIYIWFNLIFFCQKQVWTYLGWQKRANTNTNIFGLNKKGEYKYKYIRVDKKERIWIQIWIIRLVFGNRNKNTNMLQTSMLPKLKCHQNWNVSKTEMSLKLKCHQNRNVSKTEM